MRQAEKIAYEKSKKIIPGLTKCKIVKNDNGIVFYLEYSSDTPAEDMRGRLYALALITLLEHGLDGKFIIDDIATCTE